MGLEQKDSSPLSSIHIELDPPAVTFTGTDGRAITFHPVDYLRRILGAAAASPTPEASAEQAREKVITLAGKLKTKPQDGFPDGKGKPTATALFAAHLPESQDAKMYFAIFHGATTSIVRNTCDVSTSLTITWYPHQSTSPDKNDTIDVIRLEQYPGKPTNPRNGN